jgi:hypothetical protein
MILVEMGHLTSAEVGWIRRQSYHSPGEEGMCLSIDRNEVQNGMVFGGMHNGANVKASWI